MHKFKNKWTILIIVIMIAIGIASGVGIAYRNYNHNTILQAEQKVDPQNLPIISRVELQKYSGTDLILPIYIGLNNYVYDVSAGADYYKVGGTYHYLAGKDSSAELNMIGGDIIARKYPIIGKLE